jgi:hypothetical protein
MVLRWFPLMALLLLPGCREVSGRPDSGSQEEPSIDGADGLDLDADGQNDLQDADGRDSGDDAEPAVCAVEMEACDQGLDPQVLIPDQPYPLELAIDGSGIYWITLGSSPEYSDGAVWAADLDGSRVVALAQDQVRVSSLAVDATHVYWTVWGGTTAESEGSVRRIGKTGGVPEVLADRDPFGGRLDAPGDLVLDGSFVYWECGEIIRAAKQDPVPEFATWLEVDGPLPVILYTLNGAAGLCMDEERLYWSNSNDEQIVWVGKDAPAAFDVLVDRVGKYAFFLTLDERFLYWTAAGGVFKADKRMGDPRRLSCSHTANSLACDDGYVYWVGYSPAWGQSLFRVGKQGSQPCVLRSGRQQVLHNLVLGAGTAYWIEGDDIFQAALPP